MPMAAPADRRRREAAGRTAEAVCAALLRLKGFQILARRFRTPVGEIDIVARRGRLVAFVEVKARADLVTAGESVGQRQRRRIARAAQAFLQKRPELQHLDLRFDVVLLAPWRLPHHISDAWRE
jgi:putative endonuclease